jgi:hypothetical protein
MNTTDKDLIPSRQIQFWTILVFEIPSLACISYLLPNLLLKKHLRQALQNHVIIIVLFLCLLIELIDNPFFLDAYLQRGPSSFASSPAICLLWWFVDYGVYGAITVFMAWAAFERHLLIFYPHRCFNTRRKRIFFHYAPLTILSLYLCGFYLGILIFPPCENEFDYKREACGLSPCYQGIPCLNIWDYLINGSVCTLIEAFFSCTLLTRTIYRRYRVQQSIDWRKHRKMAIQLLSISFLSMTITLPQATLTTVQRTIPGMAHFAYELSSYLFFLSTFVVLLLPFICLGCYSELWPRLLRRTRTVAPIRMSAIRKLSLTVHG